MFWNTDVIVDDSMAETQEVVMTIGNSNEDDESPSCHTMNK